MASNIVSPSAFNVSKLTFSQLKLLESGGKQAYLNYDGHPLVMQIGSLETPFGLSVYDKTTPPKYTVDLKLAGYDDATSSTSKIYNAMNALDEHMIAQAVKNSRQWFKSDLNADMARMLYTPSVRFAKDQEGNVKPYPPTVKVQLRQRDGKFETEVYDDKARPLKDVPLEDILVKKAFLTVLMQCTGVWFAGGKFGLSWKSIQIRADKVPQSIRGYAFMPQDGDEEAPPARVVMKPVAKAAPPPPTNQFQSLADDDEVNDEEALAPPSQSQAQDEEEAPEDIAPAPVPPKKTTITKKKIVVAAKK